VLRFTRRFAIERKVGSFYYWYNYYTLKFAFEYIKNIVLKTSERSQDDIVHKVEEIAHGCRLATEKYIRRYLTSFFAGEISYPIFKDRINGLYHFEFYYRIAPSPLPFEDKDTIKELLKDKTERKYFLQRYEHVLNVVIGILSAHKDELDTLTERQRSAMIRYYKRSDIFEQYRAQIRESIKTESLGLAQRAFYELMFVITNYNLLVNFMKEFFRFTKISVPKRSENENEE
jgi:hypothetical protein